LEAIQCAVVAPTFPDPTMLTFLRMNESLSEVSIQHSAVSIQPFQCDELYRLNAEC
jgi:hypothetical protein